MGLLAWLGLDGDDADATVDTSRRALLREVRRPVQKAKEELEELRVDIVQATPLRPPGALPEKAFLQACDQCKACLTACKHNALILGDDGYPTFNMSEAWCHLCPDFACAEQCPTTALQRPEPESPVRLGRAILDPSACISATSFCSVCRERCPEEAISIVRGIVAIDTETCNGCGECVYRCPAPIQALRIERL